MKERFSFRLLRRHGLGAPETCHITARVEAEDDGFNALKRVPAPGFRPTTIVAYQHAKYGVTFACLVFICAWRIFLQGIGNEPRYPESLEAEVARLEIPLLKLVHSIRVLEWLLCARADALCGICSQLCPLLQNNIC
ncbi:hypothetical protein LTR28_006781, partial [Elasticomyces elasticus]